jgi:hypothetical protein
MGGPSYCSGAYIFLTSWAVVMGMSDGCTVQAVHGRNTPMYMVY